MQLKSTLKVKVNKNNLRRTSAVDDELQEALISIQKNPILVKDTKVTRVPHDYSQTASGIKSQSTADVAHRSPPTSSRRSEMNSQDVVRSPENKKVPQEPT